MGKQENKTQALGKIHMMRIKELLEIIYNKSNEMLVKCRAHFLRKNTVLAERSLQFHLPEFQSMRHCTLHIHSHTQCFDLSPLCIARMS